MKLQSKLKHRRFILARMLRWICFCHVPLRVFFSRTAADSLKKYWIINVGRPNLTVFYSIVIRNIPSEFFIYFVAKKYIFRWFYQVKSQRRNNWGRGGHAKRAIFWGSATPLIGTHPIFNAWLRPSPLEICWLIKVLLMQNGAMLVNITGERPICILTCHPKWGGGVVWGFPPPPSRVEERLPTLPPFPTPMPYLQIVRNCN